MLTELFSRLRFFFLGKSRAEVDEELQFHLERETQANIARGLSAGEGRRQAVLSFGSSEAARDQCREERPAWGFESILRDFRYGLRGLMRNPGFTTVALITLAIAIGANAAVFSLLDQALIRALPVKDPGQLVVLSFAGGVSGHVHSDGGDSPGHQHSFSYPMYLDLRDKNTVFSGLVAAASAPIGISWNNHAESVPAEMVSGNYFQTLGVAPALGRLFVASDETIPGANPVAVLSFDFWKSHLAEAQVVGKTLLINGTPFTITGVAAPGFHSMVWGQMPAVYVPITMQHMVEPEWEYLHDHHSYWLNIIGRLRPAMAAAQAAASANSLFRALRASEFTTLHDQSPKARTSFIDSARLNLDAGAKGFSPIRDDVRTPLTIIMAMVLLIIGMAVINVASLLLVRAAVRSREFSVRFALGATTWQVLRQLCAEGLLLGAAGAAIGLALAPQALRLLIHWMYSGSPDAPVFSATLDWRVLFFTIAATVLASLLFSLAPAMQFRSPRLTDALKQQMGTSSGNKLRLRRTLVALQIGLSLVLIIAAGLFVHTIQNLRDVNPGFATDHLLQFSIAPELAGYPPAQIAPVEQRVLDTIAGLPGVRSAGATNDADLSGDHRGGDVAVSGYTPKPDENFDVELPWVSNGYLQTLGVPLLVGRYFNASDTATSQKVAIVNASFARHFFGSPRATLGHHVSRPDRPATDSVIVGVVIDVKHAAVRDPAVPTSYTIFAQEEKPSALTFYVRTWQSPESAANSIRAAVANLDPKLIVSDISTMKQQIDDSILAERTTAMLATAFGILATLLAGIGIYGILAYSTAQRTRDIGIRMAFGARRSNVISLIIREVLMLAGVAILVTVPICWFATRYVRSQLFGVSDADLAVYGFAIFVISAIAALAAFLPARRAATVDPARALRTE